MSGLQCSLTYPTPNKFKTCLLKNLPGKQSSRGWGDSTHLSGTTWKKKSLISDLLSNKVSSRSNSAMATSGVLQQEDDSSWDPMHGTPLGIRSPLHPITQGMSMSRGYFGEEEDKYLDEDRRLHARESIQDEIEAKVKRDLREYHKKRLRDEHEHRPSVMRRRDHDVPSSSAPRLSHVTQVLQQYESPCFESREGSLSKLSDSHELGQIGGPKEKGGFDLFAWHSPAGKVGGLQ